ncbi:MAG: rRNA pseudouridine synthase [Timaviella obliquedivisa GSE-PSE-MK23-08B]|jgi:23S rRNA pseudouridine2605 synthase|nr:rRNA pseudouridine synthase [Timaviella obliquedivisa GSE-PSE-MK23-08B]
MTERLQKILSQWGVASRRQAEQMILDGRVCLNGEVVQIGQKADPQQDWIEVDGTHIHPTHRPTPIYLLLHKPAGVVSTCHDPEGRSTVIDLIALSVGIDAGVHPVGRLDTASTGALILTNNGAITFGLTHPRHAVPKTYQVWVDGLPYASTLEQWRDGVMLDEKMTLPAEVRVLNQDRNQTLLEIVLREGRNRQIRRVAEQLGHPVRQLHRTAIGSIRLGKLPSGQYRYLRESEIKFLQVQAEGIGQPLANLGMTEPDLKIGVSESKGHKL